MLSMNESRFATQKEEMEKQVQVLLDEKTSLEAEKELMIEQSQHRGDSKFNQNYE